MLNKKQAKEYARLLKQTFEMVKITTDGMHELNVFNEDCEMLFNTLTTEFGFWLDNKDVLSLADPKLKDIRTLLKQMGVLIHEQTAYQTTTMSLSYRFNDYMREFLEYQVAVAAPDATKTFIDEATLKIAKTLEGISEEITLNNYNYIDHCNKLAAYKNIHSRNKN